MLATKVLTALTKAGTRLDTDYSLARAKGNPPPLFYCNLTQPRVSIVYDSYSEPVRLVAASSMPLRPPDESETTVEGPLQLRHTTSTLPPSSTIVQRAHSAPATTEPQFGLSGMTDADDTPRTSTSSSDQSTPTSDPNRLPLGGRAQRVTCERCEQPSHTATSCRTELSWFQKSCGQWIGTSYSKDGKTRFAVYKFGKPPSRGRQMSRTRSSTPPQRVGYVSRDSTVSPPINRTRQSSRESTGSPPQQSSRDQKPLHHVRKYHNGSSSPPAANRRQRHE